MRFRILLVLMAVVLPVVLYSGPARADWNMNDPYKWLQLPDLRVEPGIPPLGIDVDVTDRAPPGPPPDGLPRVVADDFLCTKPDLITDIHIWGSWKFNNLPFGNNPNGVMFRLSIHSDVPANENPQGLFSKPGPILWEMEFQPTQYVSRVWESGVPEGWYDPATQLYIPNADDICWQYNFRIPDALAFLQQGTTTHPLVYWLDVDAVVQDPNPEVEFGWKTSFQHWNDDATWQLDIVDPPINSWNELRYPGGHPLYPRSIDMAFVITPEPGSVVMLLGAALFAALGWMRLRKNS
jgi:hypothetical protein